MEALAPCDTLFHRLHGFRMLSAREMRLRIDPGFVDDLRALAGCLTKAKIDAYGIGSRETRHPRWERCRALQSALERPVCFQGFSRIRALQSAPP